MSGFQGHQHSEETKNRIRDAARGRSTWNKGKSALHGHKADIAVAYTRGKSTREIGLSYGCSAETVRRALIGLEVSRRKAFTPSQNSIRKMPEARKRSIGRRGPKCHSEETKIKMSEAKQGEKNPFWGARHSLETKKRMSEAARGRRHPSYSRQGDKHPNWRGGISFEPYAAEFNTRNKRWIRERDGLRCQLCGGLQNGRNHAVHHIDYNKKNNEAGNLITLCNSCNGKVNFNRGYWMGLFEGMILGFKEALKR